MATARTRLSIRCRESLRIPSMFGSAPRERERSGNPFRVEHRARAAEGGLRDRGRSGSASMRRQLVCLGILLGASVGWTFAAAGEIHVVALKGIIHPVSASYLRDAVERADGAKAAALIIEIDTPGGLVESTKDLNQRMLVARTPIIGYVTPFGARAASGGFFVLLACDVAVMAPGTNTGAAHPVGLGADNSKDDIGLKKAESDLAAYARSLAENRARNAKLAETAVTQSISWTEKEALEAKLIDAIAVDLRDLLEKLNGRRIKKLSGEEIVLDLAGPVVRARDMTLHEKIQNFLLTPEVAGLLLLIGMLGIYVEMTHPGVIFPGVAGAVALLLFAYAAHILPINVLGLLLIGVAVVLFVLEIKIVSHGLLGIGGLVALTAGSLLLFDGPIPELRLPVLVVLPTSLAVGGIMLVVVRYVVRAHRGRVATGTQGMIGEIGIATTDLSPEGKVFVHGEYWNARADGPLPQGARVRIRAVDDMDLFVEPEGRQA